MWLDLDFGLLKEEGRLARFCWSSFIFSSNFMFSKSVIDLPKSDWFTDSFTAVADDGATFWVWDKSLRGSEVSDFSYFY